MRITTVLLTAALLAAPAAARADGGHAVSLHGTAKYGAGFPHFDYVNPDAPKGGRMTLPAIGSFDNLNPFILRGVAATGLGMLFDTLTVGSSDEVSTEYGLIAEFIEVAPDRSWVAYVLRPQARFNDGKPVTVDDVVWTFETLKEKGHPTYRSYYADVVRAEKVGDRAVRFVFAHGGNAELPVIMGQLPVLPRHVFEGRDFAATTLEPLVGSGPYTVADVQPGRSITYRRVADWWGKDLPVNRGRYNFDTIRFDYYRDVHVAFEAFKAGAYDFRLEHSSKNWVTGYDFPAVRDGLVVREELRHQDPQGIQAFVFNTRRPQFQDRKVRQALNHLFDYEWTRANISYGLFRRSKSFFSNSELAASGPPTDAELKLLEPYRDRVPDEVFSQPFEPPATDGTGNIRQNLRTALALFKDAGWELKDGRLRNVKTGEPMAFEFLLVQADMDRIVQPFIRNLERAGISATIRLVDTAQYQNRTDRFDFDVVIARFPQSLSPGNEQRDYWTSPKAEEPGSRNLIGVKDPVVDELVEKIIAAPDRASQIAGTRALDRVLSWGWYVIPHWHDDVRRVAYWNRFSHPAVGPKYGLGVLDTWWVDPAKDAKLAAALGRARN